MPRVVALLTGLLLVAGCSGSHDAFAQPRAGAFKAGPCRTVADPVLSVGRDARRLGKGATPPEKVRADLKAAQAAVIKVQPGLDPVLVAPFSGLVVAIGLVRLRSDSHTYEPSLGVALSTAYDAVVSACTA